MLIRVVPSSISAYSTQANGQFESIQEQLRQIIVECVGVEYHGENAVAFKNETGEMAAAFARQMNAQLGGMVNAVNASMARIAGSLGGAPPMVGFTAQSTVVPTPVQLTADLYDVDTSGLSTLKGTISRSFGVVRAQLAAHRGALEGTDWLGNAKTSAVSEVGTLTIAASNLCDTHLTQLSTRIDQQIQSSQAADALAMG